LPKRKIKEEKPKKRLGKKELLIVPIAMGGATLVALVIIPALAPPPEPWSVCLRGEEGIEQFQLHPRIEVIVDGKPMLLPDDVGKQPRDGQECRRPIHTDEVGSIVHIEYIRPVRLTLGDFMRIYNDTNTITVVDNSTGANVEQTLNLANYNIEYSYFSEAGEFTKVTNPFDAPPFPSDNRMVARIELTLKQ
jgi:hypothetical protein